MSASDDSSSGPDPGMRPESDAAAAAEPSRQDIVRARIDREGRLLAADAPIAALQEGAGGTIGGGW